MKEVVKDLKDRRNDRYDAILLRLKSFRETSNFYKNQTANELTNKAFNLIKNFTIQDTQGNGKNTIYTRWLNVKAEDRDTYIDEVISNIKQANEIFIKQELAKTENILIKTYINNNINNIDVENRGKYLGAIKLLVHLDKIGKTNILNSELYELRKDLISCIDYNTKIQKELTQNIPHEEELTVEFIDSIINVHEVGELV